MIDSYLQWTACASLFYIELARFTARAAVLRGCTYVCWLNITLNPSPFSNYQLVPYRNPAAPNCYPDSTSKQATHPSISNFTSIFDAATKEYKKLTKKDLHTHPFAAQFNKCDTPHAVLDVFRKQAQAFEEFRKGDDRLITWLDLTVNILSKCSATIGEALSSVVCLERCTSFLVTAF